MTDSEADQIARMMGRMQDKASALEQTQNLTLAELFPAPFMLRHTRHQSIDDMFLASGFKVETQEDFDAVPAGEWDIFIQNTTDFSSWDEMKKIATQAYLRQMLFS